MSMKMKLAVNLFQNAIYLFVFLVLVRVNNYWSEYIEVLQVPEQSSVSVIYRRILSTVDFSS